MNVKPINNLKTSPSTSGFPLDARQGTVLGDRLDLIERTINLMLDSYLTDEYGNLVLTEDSKVITTIN